MKHVPTSFAPDTASCALDFPDYCRDAGCSRLLRSAPMQAAIQPTGPWTKHRNFSADESADLVVKEMTLDEKIAVLHGVGMPTDDPLTQENMPSNRGVGYEVGVPRLGIPGIDMSDAAYGVRSSGANGRYSTALPANVAAAASWDTNAAYEYGKLIGTELRAQGYNMSLGGGSESLPASRATTGAPSSISARIPFLRELWSPNSSRARSRST